MTGPSAREQRLAEQLRANLHRRKAQAREQRDEPPAPQAEEPRPEDQSGAV